MPSREVKVGSRAKVASLVVLVAVTVAQPVRGASQLQGSDWEVAASGPGVDATYGRIDHDMAWVGGAGVAVASEGVRSWTEMRLRYLQSVGLSFAWEEGLGVPDGGQRRRAFVPALEVRPVFFARWLRGWESGFRGLDLFVDSLGLTMEVPLVSRPGTSWGTDPGFGLGVVAEVPLTSGPGGPWIGFRGGFRWGKSGDPGSASVAEQSVIGALVFAWHLPFRSPIIDAGDVRVE